MARIRSVKPEFWTSEQIASCSRDARLLFIGMWNFCDDAGIHPKSYKRLKMEILPGDDCSVNDIKTWVTELLHADLLIEYSAEGKDYWIVSGWKHQKIDRPTYKHPKPAASCSNGTQYQFADHSAKNPQQLVEHSSNGRHPLTPGKEGIGKGDRKEEDICKVSSETSPPSFCDYDLSANTHEIDDHQMNNQQINGDHSKKPGGTNFMNDESNILEVFQYWQAKMNHPRAKLDKKRKSIIQAAIKQGYTLEELKQAIDGCHKTPYNMGNNPQKKKYDDIGLVLRDASHIERFMGNAMENSSESNLNSTISQMDQIAAGAI